MTYLNKMDGLSLQSDGSIYIGRIDVICSEHIGGKYAMYFESNFNDETSMGRAEFFYATRPLEDRYARFVERLNLALAARSP